MAERPDANPCDPADRREVGSPVGPGAAEVKLLAMRVLLLSYGSRGDCEPFLAVGELLRARGDEVVCAFPEQFRGLAESGGFDFHTLGGEFLDQLESDDMKVALSGSGGRRVMGYLRASSRGMDTQRLMVDRQADAIRCARPDLVIHHSKCAYVVPWATLNGRKSMLFALQPALLHEVKGTAHVGMPRWMPAWLSYALMRLGFVMMALLVVERHFKDELTAQQVRRAILAEAVAYNVSPALFAQPKYWPGHVRVVGFIERDKTAAWSPPAELTDFLDAREKVLFLTFGSMTNSDPAANTTLFLQALSDCGIPAVINTAGGAFAEPEHRHGADVLFVDEVPYDWVLPRVGAVVHHGGAGTVHSALKAGRPTMAIPHGFDQPLWDELIARAGVGPRGIPIGKLTLKHLKVKLLDLWQNPRYRRAAERVGRRMRAEKSGAVFNDFVTRVTKSRRGTI